MFFQATLGFLLIELFLGVGAPELRAQDQPAARRTWDFEADAAGAAPSGFKLVMGQWSVALDGKNHVLAQT
ncbi:MAG TPA: hypothetical protein VGM05_23300, partial [Planctomycetaceae bacterium]